jgi:hypothetical protein
MKYQQAKRTFQRAWWVVVLGLGLAGCSSEEPASTESGGEASKTASGGAPADSPVLICGVAPTKSLCDPVTTAPCDILAGQTCDYSIRTGRYQCFDGPNLVEPGGKCDSLANFCAAGASCNVEIERCQRFCCSDLDCAEGTCRTSYRKDGEAMIGICLDEYANAPGGAGGEGGSEP